MRGCMSAIRRSARLLKARNLSTRVGSYLSARQHHGTFSVESLKCVGDEFSQRHIGPQDYELDSMLEAIGVDSVDQLIEETVPKDLLNTSLVPESKAEILTPDGLGEVQALQELQDIMSENKVQNVFIGQGYYQTVTPKVILRNILEDPGWYTPYTPYQAEISQGRLEMLLNFQSAVVDLTGMDIANASLLDEATAAAEAMNIARIEYEARTRRRGEAPVFIVAEHVHTSSRGVVTTRALELGVEVEVLPFDEIPERVAALKQEAQDKEWKHSRLSGVLVQYPDTNGNLHQTVEQLKSLSSAVQEQKGLMVAATDLLACTQLVPPGEWGADIALGSSQRFGVPMGFGGPHAAFFAANESLQRKIPGRVIGLSKDSRGLPALRMAMQSREQHIRRDRASSNICTAQALLANVAGAYAVYHGPKGLHSIGARVHALASLFGQGLRQAGYDLAGDNYFDTVGVTVADGDALEALAAKADIALHRVNATDFSVSFGEGHTSADVQAVLDLFQDPSVSGRQLLTPVDVNSLSELEDTLDKQYTRTSSYLTHPIFSAHHSETRMLRYLTSLQERDLSLAHAMIPLGSCTMKLNATSEMIPVTWPTVGNIHPMQKPDTVKGYAKMLEQLNHALSDITGFDRISFQPNSGAQGEYLGLLAIKRYHDAKDGGKSDRDVCLIPTSAHGTNPASASLAGLKTVPVKCDKEGNIDIKDLEKKCAKHEGKISSAMITYPSTHGVYETQIRAACKMVHDAGGLVYMDGANLNAQLGICSPGTIGADVCHLNLHKTFCIPHGGGGPGMGPIGVAKHLTPFLPDGPPSEVGASSELWGERCGPVAAAEFASASILPITWMYIRMMGKSGLRKATDIAMLNANYLRAALENDYKILYSGENGHCAHEFIIDCRPLKKFGIVEEDIAKRLMDYGFHAPTMSFPVAGTLMVEPTESEPKEELDRFIEAMMLIREEIRAVEEGKVAAEDSVLKHAPHTADVVISDDWDRKYGREEAAYPVDSLRTNKFWPYVGRIDSTYGDRNLFCTCPPWEGSDM